MNEVGVAAVGGPELLPTSPAGTTINYFLDGRINRAEILFPGVFCFLCAALTGAFLHKARPSASNNFPLYTMHLTCN